MKHHYSSAWSYLLHAAAIALVLSGKAAAQSPDEAAVALELDLPVTLQLTTDNRFRFSILYSDRVGDAPANPPFVRCGQQVRCDPEPDVVEERGFRTVRYVATVPSPLPDAVEISTQLIAVREGKEAVVKSDAKIALISFNDHSLELRLGGEAPLLGGSVLDTVLQFKAGTAVVTPALPVRLTLTSPCIQFAAGSHGEAFGRSIDVDFGDDKVSAPVSNTLSISPSLWHSDICVIQARGAIRGRNASRDVGPFPINVIVAPAFTPSLLMALAGALLQYLLSGLVLVIEEAQKRTVGADGKRRVKRLSASETKALFGRMFVGPAGEKVLSAVLKGVLAFIAAAILKDSNIFGITIQRGSFMGFLTLGFLLGFWPIEKLWTAFAKLAGLDRGGSNAPAGVEGDSGKQLA